MKYPQLGILVVMVMVINFAIHVWATMLALGILHAEIAGSIPAPGLVGSVPIAIATILILKPPHVTASSE